MKPDREVNHKHDDLYAKAWESDFGKLVHDNDQNDRSPPYPREVIVESGQTNAKACSIPKTTREVSLENFSYRLCGGTIT